MFEHEAPAKSKASRDFIVAMLLLASGIFCLFLGLASHIQAVMFLGGILIFLGAFFQGSRMIKYN
jgi:uncharacterized membrane protein HdeD (DUF308 family)